MDDPTRDSAAANFACVLVGTLVMVGAFALVSRMMVFALDSIRGTIP